MTARAIFRVFGCCVIAVVVLEICARVDDYVSFGAPLLSPYNSESLYMRDSLGKRGKPNARYKKWQLNSLGYRGPSVQPGKTNVVVFGSSETFGLYEKPGEEYPRQLERELNSESGADRFQVINVAYPGESMPTASVRVPEIVDVLHPEYAIIYASPATYIWMPWLETSKTQKAAAPAQSGFELRIAENARNALKQLIPDSLQTRLRQHEIKKAAQEYPVMARVPEANVEAFRADLAAFVEQLRLRGVAPILVTHATRFGKTLSPRDQDILLAWRKFYPMLEEEGFLDMEARMNDATRSVAAEKTITLVDAAREIPSGDEYFADFVHFTDLGAHTMAITLAQGLRQEMAKQGIALPSRKDARSANSNSKQAALDTQ